MEETKKIPEDITQTPEVQALEKDEEAMKAFKSDQARVEYLDRVERGELTPEEKSARNARLVAMGYKPEE